MSSAIPFYHIRALDYHLMRSGVTPKRESIISK